MSIVLNQARCSISLANELLCCALNLFVLHHATIVGEGFLPSALVDWQRTSTLRHAVGATDAKNWELLGLEVWGLRALNVRGSNA